MVGVNRRSALQMAIGLAVLSSVASAQRPDPPPPVPSPHFEVASIKRNLSGSTDDRMNVFPGGRLVASNIPILTLIRNVYRVQYSQLAGGPEWLATERWLRFREPGGRRPRLAVYGATGTTRAEARFAERASRVPGY